MSKSYNYVSFKYVIHFTREALQISKNYEKDVDDPAHIRYVKCC